MKRVYEKPTVIFMELRPEERMALCDWPIGYEPTGKDHCKKAYLDIAELSSQCFDKNNNSAESCS